MQMPEGAVSLIERAAERSVEKGANVELNRRIPTVAVTMESGQQFFFQGEEAAELLGEVPENVEAESWLLWLATGW